MLCQGKVTCESAPVNTKPTMMINEREEFDEEKLLPLFGVTGWFLGGTDLLLSVT